MSEKRNAHIAATISSVVETHRREIISERVLFNFFFCLGTGNFLNGVHVEKISCSFAACHSKRVVSRIHSCFVCVYSAQIFATVADKAHLRHNFKWREKKNWEENKTHNKNKQSSTFYLYLSRLFDCTSFCLLSPVYITQRRYKRKHRQSINQQLQKKLFQCVVCFNSTNPPLMHKKCEQGWECWTLFFMREEKKSNERRMETKQPHKNWKWLKKIHNIKMYKRKMTNVSIVAIHQT